MAKASLTYNKSWYTPVQIKSTMSSGNTADVRKEYTRLRDISQKRLKRMAKAGMSGTQVYRMNIGHFPKLKDIGSAQELAQRLSDLSRFIQAERSTVSGQKAIMKKSISTLHEHGYDFVNEGNYNKFGEFMEEYRVQMLDMDYDSGDAAEVFSIMEKHNIDPMAVKDDFEYWIQNIDELEKLRRSKASAGDIAKLRTRLNKKLGERVKKRGL